MNKIKNISILALILLSVGIIGSILTYNKSSKPFKISYGNGIIVFEDKISYGNGNGNKNEIIVLEETIINDNFTSIISNSDNAFVEIIPTDSTTKITIDGVSSSLDYDFSALVKDDTLYIDLKDQYSSSNFPFNTNNSTLKLKIYVPKKVYELIQVNVDNGLVEADSINSNNIIVSSDNGKIDLTNIISVNIDLQSSNGQIKFTGNVSGKIIGEIDNGQFDFTLKNMDLPIDLKSSNGIIKIKTDKEPENVTYDIEVGLGIINIFDKYSGNAVVGNGENLIKLETDNGKISITK